MLKKPASLLTITSLFLAIAIGSCSKLCNSGYEGSRCNELITTKFIATWNAIDTPGNLVYTDTLTQGADINGITISSAFAGHYFMHHINASAEGTVITIPYQQPDTSVSHFVQGTGVISNNNSTISFTYQILTGADTPLVITNYAGTWTRQN